MQTYEAMFLIRPGLSEEEQKKQVEEFEKILKENKAEIKSSQVFGKRQLAYEIKKYREGLYYLINFTAIGELVISKLKHACNINENILRVLVIRQGRN